MRFNAATDGKLQVLAAVALLEQSRLVEWMPKHAKFQAVPHDTFELSWKKDVDPVFGRLICWISFSAGAEFLAKGVCILRGIEVRRPGITPEYPRSDFQEWAARFRASPDSEGVVSVTHFGTLGNLTNNTSGALVRLCRSAHASQEQEDLVVAAYLLLQRSIRNRDAHAYAPNVRDQHYNLVPQQSRLPL